MIHPAEVPPRKLRKTLPFKRERDCIQKSRTPGFPSPSFCSLKQAGSNSTAPFKDTIFRQDEREGKKRNVDQEVRRQHDADEEEAATQRKEEEKGGMTSCEVGWVKMESAGGESELSGGDK